MIVFILSKEQSHGKFYGRWLDPSIDVLTNGYDLQPGEDISSTNNCVCRNAWQGNLQPALEASVKVRIPCTTETKQKGRIVAVEGILICLSSLEL